MLGKCSAAGLKSRKKQHHSLGAFSRVGRRVLFVSGRLLIHITFRAGPEADDSMRLSFSFAERAKDVPDHFAI